MCTHSFWMCQKKPQISRKKETTCKLCKQGVKVTASLVKPEESKSEQEIWFSVGTNKEEMSKNGDESIAGCYRYL